MIPGNRLTFSEDGEFTRWSGKNSAGWALFTVIAVLIRLHARTADETKQCRAQESAPEAGHQTRNRPSDVTIELHSEFHSGTQATHRNILQVGAVVVVVVVVERVATNDGIQFSAELFEFLYCGNAERIAILVIGGEVLGVAVVYAVSPTEKNRCTQPTLV